MFCDTNYRKISKYLLLGFICSVSVFSAATTTAAKQRDGEDESIYHDGEDTSLLDLFRSTTTERYTREDQTVPTSKPEGHPKVKWSLDPFPCVLYLIMGIAGFVVVLVIIGVYIERNIKSCSAEPPSHSSISSEKLTTFHRSSE